MSVKTKNITKKSKTFRIKKPVQKINTNFPIIFEDVNFTYNKKTPYSFNALKNVNVSINKNIITAIIGSTGSGKSTLIKHINALILPDEGKIKIGDFEINQKTKKIKNVKSLRKSIGLVFQFPEYQLFEDTVEKDVMYGALNMGISKLEAASLARKYLDIVGIDGTLYKNSPFNLSGGQKRRVAIAGILSLEGDTIILDEPTAGLDPQGEKSFIHLFKKLNLETKKRIIFISHNMDNVLEIADEIIAMKDGKVQFQGSPFEIFQNLELIKDLNLTIPKVYRLINNLADKGFDFKNSKIRTIDDFTNHIKKNIKKIH